MRTSTSILFLKPFLCFHVSSALGQGQALFPWWLLLSGSRADDGLSWFWKQLCQDLGISTGLAINRSYLTYCFSGTGIYEFILGQVGFSIFYCIFSTKVYCKENCATTAPLFTASSDAYLTHQRNGNTFATFCYCLVRASCALWCLMYAVREESQRRACYAEQMASHFCGGLVYSLIIP